MASKMVKVNLLQDQQGSGEVKRVVRKASGVTQQVVMVVVSVAILVVVVALDYFQANLESKRVQADLAVQTARAEELKKLTVRREELAKQKQAVDDRIAVKFSPFRKARVDPTGVGTERGLFRGDAVDRACRHA